MNMIEAMVMTTIGIIAITHAFPLGMREGIGWGIIAIYINVVGSFLTRRGLPYYAWTGERSW